MFANKTEGEHCTVFATGFDTQPRARQRLWTMLAAEVMLGLATLHLSMRELYLKIAEIPRNAID
jgi:hypothetical protein